MEIRPALAIALLLATGCAAASASAQEVPRRRILSIAPGTPATVGQGGAVDGLVPHQAVPAPHGAMATFGGLLGTGAPRPTPAPATAPAASAPATPH